MRYLEDGGVGPSFIEDGEPVASREKPCPMSKPLIDVISSVQRPEPPTLVVAELISQMVKDNSSAYEDPDFNEDMIKKLSKCYAKFASQEDEKGGNGLNGKIMSKDDVEKWLITINKKLGRGSEFRTAAKEMGWTAPEPEDGGEKATEKPRITLPDEGLLTLDGFLNVYTAELRGGKFWGITYALSIMGEPLPTVGRFEARVDRMYCTEQLVPAAVLDTIATMPYPNDVEPSDHLPVAACFKIVKLN